MGGGHIIFIILEILFSFSLSQFSPIWFCGFSPSQVFFKCRPPGAAGLWGLSLVQDTGSSACTIKICNSCTNPPKYMRVTKIGRNASNFSVIAKFTVYQTRLFVRGLRVETPAMWVESYHFPTELHVLWHSSGYSVIFTTLSVKLFNWILLSGWWGRALSLWEWWSMVPGAFSTFDLSLDCCSIVVFICADGHCQLRHWLRQSWGAGGLHHGCKHT